MVVGLAVTVAPVVADNSIEGLHVYEVPPLAVMDTLLPLQIVAEEGETVIVVALTVISTSDVEEQVPFEIVQRKVYVPAPPAGVKVAVGFDVLLN